MYSYSGPNDWYETSLYDVAKWKNGLAFKNIDFSDTGMPVIKIAELKNGIINQTKFTQAQYSDDVYVQEGSMLFAWSGSPQTSIDTFIWRGENGWLNQHIFKVSPNDIIEADFLYFLLKSLRPRFVRIALNKQTTGLGHVTVADLKEIRVGIPKRHEQLEILSVVGPLEKRVENNRAMNETLEEMARAIFKSWFVDFDPVHAKSRGEQPAHMDAETAALFPDRFGDDGLPEGWHEGRVEDLIDFNPKEKLSKGNLATYVEMAHLPTQGPSINHWEKREFKSGTKFRNGDTLFARITPCLENGKTAFVDILEDDEVAWGSTEYIVMRSKKWVPSAFSYVLARHSPFRETAQKSMTGTSGRQRAQADVISDFKIALPPNDIFNAYADLIEIWFQKIRMNARENRTLAELRDTLLPKLMSGEIRIKDAERAVGAAV
jgi:type I restriction enzyme S subunit